MLKKKLVQIILMGLALTALAPLAFAELIVPAAPNGYVLDQAEVLDVETELQLELQLGTLQTDTSTQIVVVTVPDLQGYPVEKFALEIGRTWGVGQEEFDNGVVFLIAPNERLIRLEIGRGLEGAITDLQSNLILNHSIAPHLAEDDYNTGVLEGIAQLEILARGEEFNLEELAQSNPDELSLLATLFFIFMPFVWLFFSWLADTKAWWLGGLFGLAIALVASFTLFSAAIGAFAGLFIDFILSKYFYKKLGKKYRSGFLTGGGRYGGGSSGGFGGFGGGGFGGGGASGGF
ncbi:TPM domain-containing protein [Candidatus Peregrinibacteria bacterium]|nr:TPM domain-containing protein [Candidatus Peregrinibacteria bacterium]MBT4632362.1 TPM domain-containing protein [Candidatus Peregrinibacteria bacterium]MBT5516321.1 TPM domain-containing protein [Candidatus Peregrinibacteria bacterium]